MLKKCKEVIKECWWAKNAHFIIYYSMKTNSNHVFLKKEIAIKYSAYNI